MPRRLSELGTHPKTMYDALCADPLDRLAQDALADSLEEQGEANHAALIRNTSLWALEAMRGVVLDERTSESFARRLGTATPPRPSRLAASLSYDEELRGDAMLALVDRDGSLDPEKLRGQWGFQLALLTGFGLLERQHGAYGVTGIDGWFYTLPLYEQVEARLREPGMLQKVKEGFNLLLLVPFAASLRWQLAPAWEQSIRGNAQTIAEGLDPTPVSIDYLSLRQFVYSPSHRGVVHRLDPSKRELLSATGRGWNAILVEGELTNLPRSTECAVPVAGRERARTGRSPEEYLAPMSSTEVGLTPEDYVIAAVTSLERTGRHLDSVSESYLLGVSDTSEFRHVAVGGWHDLTREATMYMRDTSDLLDHIGARTAVRVL